MFSTNNIKISLKSEYLHLILKVLLFNSKEIGKDNLRRVEFQVFYTEMELKLDFDITYFCGICKYFDRFILVIAAL